METHKHSTNSGKCMNSDEVGQDYTEAMDWYLKASSQDHAQAQYAIGLCMSMVAGLKPMPLLLRNGTPKQRTKETHGQSTIWRCYILMEKVLKPMNKKANDLYLQAANLGHFQAQYNLGARYASGRGFDVDLVASYFWFERSKLGASALNQERANKMIETISAHMTPEEIVIAQAKVQEIFKQID